MTLQENPKETSTEEQDNFRRSKKKVKTREAVETQVEAEVVNLEKDDENSSKPMDESPVQNIENKEDARVLDKGIEDGVPPKSVRSLKWGDEADNIPSFKEKLLGLNGRGNANNNKFRFDVLENEGENISKETTEQEQDKSEAQPMDIQASSPNKETRNQNHQQGPTQGKNKRDESSTQNARKTEQPPRTNTNQKRSVKTPQEKASSHTVVISNSSNIKNISSQATQSSPLRAGHSNPKNNSKVSSEGGKKSKKPPYYYDEQLEMRRIEEKNLRDSDSVAWDQTHDGSFTVKSAYNLIESGDQSVNHNLWKKIWKCPCTENNRFFLWRLGNESIMTNTNRLKRGFTASDICHRCGESPETVLHAVRDCKWTKPVWDLLVHRSAKNRFFSCNLQDWMEENLTTHKGKNREFPWSTTFAIGSWLCWKQRNDEIFNKKTTDVNFLAQKTLSEVQNYIKAAGTCKLVNNMLEDEIVENTNWQAPEDGWCKVNVDGSWKADTGKNQFFSIHQDVRALTCRNWDVNIRYVQRNGNIAANLMAKMGHNLPYGAKMYPSPPDICISVIREESFIGC
ncbi:putative ribonuclease H protein At1g65750 family [Senna tora]|uniref:Putative ribonuclease H protein At1g65750 family n=1 Tax=Senna tora TaxID=362788 RepID=A0A835C768_9FABA|nr:putative ribonuclease H protein At1g65750 family [Senna tora]